MKIYLLYFITTLLVAWMILILFGVSAGFANMFPVVALIGCLLLFAIAIPLIVYFKSIGLWIGFLALLMMLPFSIGFTVSSFDEGFFNRGTLFGLLPMVLVIVSIYSTVKALFFSKGLEVPFFANSGIKMLLAAIPIMLTILYFVFYGKVWL